MLHENPLRKINSKKSRKATRTLSQLPNTPCLPG